MKTSRDQNRLSRLAHMAAMVLAVALAGVARVTPSASAALPKFTSTVELRTPAGTPAGSNDVETSRNDPVSAGYGAAGTYGSNAVRWTADGSATFLPRPPGYENATYIRAMGINDGGQVVGHLSPDGRAVRWDANGEPTLLDGAAPGSYGTGANGINNLGQAVGEDYGAMPDGDVGAIRWEADGSAASLGEVLGQTTIRSIAYNINDAGQAVGYARLLEGFDRVDRAVRWEADGSATLLGNAPGQAGYSLAVGINNAGEAVGEAALFSTVLAVRWAADGSATRLGDLPGHITGLSQAWGITDDGLVAGYAFLEGIGNRGVIWDADGTPSMLQDLMADGNAWTFTGIEGIAANATTLRVLAIGSKNGGPFNYYFVNASIPEPTGAGVLTLAAPALLAWRRRALKHPSDTHPRVRARSAHLGRELIMKSDSSTNRLEIEWPECRRLPMTTQKSR